MCFLLPSVYTKYIPCMYHTYTCIYNWYSMYLLFSGCSGTHCPPVASRGQHARHTWEELVGGRVDQRDSWQCTDNHQGFRFEISRTEEGRQQFGASNWAVSFQLAQVLCGPDCVPVSFIIYNDSTLIESSSSIEYQYIQQVLMNISIVSIWDINTIYPVYTILDISFYLMK